jgi:hypothetical protein
MLRPQGPCRTITLSVVMGQVTWICANWGGFKAMLSA